MPISVEYDREADAVYVRLREGRREKAVELDERVYADIDADGHLTGLEFLYPSLGFDLGRALAHFGLLEHLPQITAALVESGVPHVQTYTGRGWNLASSSMASVAVEGTVGAGAGLNGTSVSRAKTQPLLVGT